MQVFFSVWGPSLQSFSVETVFCEVNLLFFLVNVVGVLSLLLLCLGGHFGGGVLRLFLDAGDGGGELQVLSQYSDEAGDAGLDRLAGDC